MSKTKVIIGMSGGVDSSVSALHLKEQGYDVHGVFMKNWQDDDDQCSAEADAKDAKAVCDHLGIPLSIVNFSQNYWDLVFQYFLDEYQAGRTPNPDILCNKEIKFKAFLDHALSLGADFIATGHYVQCDERDGAYRLLKGLDPNKDQSYFLYTLNQDALSKSLFPVGSLEKAKVRERAKEAGLVTFSKKDSTGICFIGERKFKSFLQSYLPAKPGDIETDEGVKVGHHDGLMYYTLGQRKGINVGGLKGYDEAPWYVLEKDIVRNILIIGQNESHPKLFKRTLQANQCHWVSGKPPAIPSKLSAKVRYRQADQACTITTLNKDVISVEFDEPQRAITPGQSVVLYDEQSCLGGAVILS